MPAGAFQRASYLPGGSALHRCDARVKLALLSTFLLTVALLPIGAWVVYALIGGLLLAGLLISELPLAVLYKRSLILEIPMMLVLLPQLFIKNGDSLELAIFSYHHIYLSVMGLERIVSLLIRSWLSLQGAVLITSVTRFEDLLAAMRACGLPHLLTAIFGLMWRYLFILIEEAGRMSQARASRSAANQSGAVLPLVSFIWSARVTGGMAGALLLRSLERSERIYQAMQARGYDGHLRGSIMEEPFTAKQKGLTLLFVSTGFLLLFIAYGWKMR